MKLLTKERGLAYAQLARIDKPIGTLLLLWPTLWALCLAAGTGWTEIRMELRNATILMLPAGRSHPARRRTATR